MNDIFKKAGKKVRNTNLGIGVVCLLLGILLMWHYIPDSMSILFAGENFQLCKAYELVEQKYYACNDNLIYDWYAEADEGRFYITYIEDYGNKPKYMGFFVPNAYIDKAETIADEIYEGKPVTTSFRGKGYILEMDEREKGFFNDYFDTFDPAEKDDLVYKTFVFVPYKEIFNFETVMILLLGSVSMLAGFVFIANGTMGGYELGLRKFLHENNISRKDFAYEMSNCRTFANSTFYCGDEYMLATNFKLDCFRYTDIEMVRPITQKVNNYVYFVKVGSTINYKVQFVMKQGKPKVYQVPSFEDAKFLCEFLAEKEPPVRVIWDNLYHQSL